MSCALLSNPYEVRILTASWLGDKWYWSDITCLHASAHVHAFRNFLRDHAAVHFRCHISRPVWSMPSYFIVCCAQPLCQCEHTRTSQREPIVDVLPRRLVAVERIYNYQSRTETEPLSRAAKEPPSRAAMEPLGRRNSRSRDEASGHFGHSRKYRELAPRAVPRCTRAPRMWSNTYGGESIVGAQSVHPDTRGGHDRAWAHTSVGDLDRVPSGSGVRSRHSAYSHVNSHSGPQGSRTQGHSSHSTLARGSSNSLRYGGPLRFEGELGGPFIRVQQ